MKVIEDILEMKAAADSARARGETIVLVPTMGALHEGHMELLRTGREAGDLLVASLFVNPSQFAAGEDFSSYPADLARDTEKAEAAGVDVLFHPDASAIYPPGFETHVEVERLSRHLCGLSRPGHLRGVATVVLKLLNITRADKAVFGMKDFQQLLVVKRMVRDLDLDVDIVAVETVRDHDGLAVSSRNAYLDPLERKAALAIPRSLEAAKAGFSSGMRSAADILREAEKVIEAEPRAVIEYLSLSDLDTLEDLEVVDKTALLAVAVRIGKARLIDNCLIFDI